MEDADVRFDRIVGERRHVEDLLTEYPALSCEDIMECLDCAAGLAEERVTPIEVTSL